MKRRALIIALLSTWLLTACGPGGTFNLPEAGENETSGGVIVPLELPDFVTKNQLVGKAVIKVIKNDRIYNEITQPVFDVFFTKGTAPLDILGVTFAGVPTALFAQDGIKDVKKNIPIDVHHFLYTPDATKISVAYSTDIKDPSKTALMTLNVAPDLNTGSKYVVVPGQEAWDVVKTNAYPRADYVAYKGDDRMFVKVLETLDGQKIRLGTVSIEKAVNAEGNGSNSDLHQPLSPRFSDGAIRSSNPDQSRPFSSLFLVGGIRSSNLPIQGLVKYKGTIMMTAQADAQSNRFAGWGLSDQGATEDRASIELEADFSNRKVNGSFNVSYDNGLFKAKYDIKAIIIANAAIGVAEGKFKTEHDPIANGAPDLDKVKEKTSALFNAAFYGEKAEVLAGYMREQKGQWAAIFGAKSTEEQNTVYLGNRYQAGVFLASVKKNAKGELDYQTGKYDPFQRVNFSGNLKALEVGGLVIHVKSTKSKRGDYKSTNLSFGQWPRIEDETQNEGLTDAEKALAEKMNEEAKILSKKHLGGFFLQGFLTSADVVAKKTGQVHYKGQWDFTASDDKGTYTSYGKKARVLFTADFDKKTVGGDFYNQEDVRVIHFDNGVIAGNGWTAENVLIKGLRSAKQDQDVLNVASEFSTNDIYIKAWFYGPMAEETGGYMYSESTKAAGVFGAAHYTPTSANSGE